MTLYAIIQHEIEQPIEVEKVYAKWYTRISERLTKANYANIIELYLSGAHVDEVRKLHKLSRNDVYRIISLYYKKPDFNMTLLSRV